MHFRELRRRRGGFGRRSVADAAMRRHPRGGKAAPTRHRRGRCAAVARHERAGCAPMTHQGCACDAAGGRCAMSCAKGSLSRRAWMVIACCHARSNGVPVRRDRSRCALDRDIPAARAARVTQPVSSRATRKMRCLADVQWERAGWAGGGAGMWCCFIRQYGSDEILHWKCLVATADDSTADVG